MKFVEIFIIFGTGVNVYACFRTVFAKQKAKIFCLLLINKSYGRGNSPVNCELYRKFYFLIL